MYEAFRFREHVEAHAEDLDGMSVVARDGDVGNVDGVIASTGGFVVLVSTGIFGFGKPRKVPAGLIVDVDPERQAVRVDADSRTIKDAPQHDDDVPHGPSMETVLLEHYGEFAEVDPSLSVPTTTEARGDTAVEEVEPAPPGRSTPPHAAPAATAFGEPPSAGSGIFADTSLGGDAPAPPSPASPGSGEDQDQRESAPAAHPLDAALATETESQAREAPASGSTDVPQARPSDEADQSATPRRGASRGGRSLPIPGYDDLSAAEVATRLRGLSQSDLTKIERYERKHASRKTVLERIDSLRGDQPWRGYDGQNVADVKKKLAKAEPETARFVREYERRHKERAGVLQAAQRRLDEA